MREDQDSGDPLVTGIKILAGAIIGAAVIIGTVIFSKIKLENNVQNVEKDTNSEPTEDVNKDQTVEPKPQTKNTTITKIDTVVENVKSVQEICIRVGNIIQSVMYVVNSCKNSFNNTPHPNEYGRYGDPYGNYYGNVDLGNNFTRISPFILRHNSQHTNHFNEFRGF